MFNSSRRARAKPAAAVHIVQTGEDTSLAPEERRGHPRVALGLPGLLYLAAEKTMQQCTILDVSASGVLVICQDVPPPSAFVILHIEGFGRFEAVTAGFRNGSLALRLLVREHRRTKLILQIAAFLGHGLEAAALCGVESRVSP